MRYPIKPKECIYCGGSMEVVLDDDEEVSSVCQQCGSNRVWEDSPLGFADYWKESVNDER